MRVVKPVAPPVVPFEFVKNARERPLPHLVEPVHRQRVPGALLPGEGRLTGKRTPRGHSPGTRAQTVPVVQVAVKTPARFKHMDGCDDEPGHAGFGSNPLVARAIGEHLPAQGIYLVEASLAQFATGVEFGVMPLQIAGKID